MNQCERCIMDRSAPEITFDNLGHCNFCTQAERSLAEVNRDKVNLPKVVDEIKKAGEGKEYDCLVGLSGGVDSSYTLHCAVKLGLRPLAFTVDNGWNDPKADENIMRLVETLKVPFYRYSIDLKKFRELQSAFMRAGLKNIEIPTDHILMATSFEMAQKNGIKHILSGGNVATESIMPESWGYTARDLVHIKDVFRRMTGRKLKGLPVCSLLKWNWYRWFYGLKTVYLLDYLTYSRAEAIEVLEKEYGYKPYGEKHCESTFTWWFQNYYLFEKFGIDKRKAHLSSEIIAGHITRKEALEKLAERPVYPQLPALERRIWLYSKREHESFKKDKYPLVAKLVKSCR